MFGGNFVFFGGFFHFSLSTEAQLQEQPGESGARQHHQEEDLLAQLSPAQPQLREGGEEGAAAEAAGWERGQLHPDDQCENSSHRGGQWQGELCLSRVWAATDNGTSVDKFDTNYPDSFDLGWTIFFGKGDCQH